MSTLDELFKENTYYEDKIVYLILEYKKLFVKMLKRKGIENANEKELFTILANQVKEAYPELKNNIFSVIYYYGYEKDLEEKLYYMLKLYKMIKEKIYGK